jgi:hypothetical protein
MSLPRFPAPVAGSSTDFFLSNMDPIMPTDTSSQDAPISVEQIEYMHWAMQIAQVCMYFHSHGRLPCGDGGLGLDISDAQIRDDLITNIDAFIARNDLSACDHKERLRIVVRETETAQGSDLSEQQDAALLLASIINMSDIIAHDTHDKYGSSGPMKELLDNLGKILLPLKEGIFGKRLPPAASNTWPDFAKLVDA